MNSVSAVTDPAAPKVLEAHGSAGDQFDFNNVYFARHVTVQIPHYTGMARGHTVRMTWENPRHTYHSEVVTVVTPGALNILTPRMEVIDSIGHTVKVFYTVRTAPGGTLIASRYLLLHILPQAFDLLAPTLSSDQTTIGAHYTGMTTGYTVRIRATANTTWQSQSQPVQTGVPSTFTLPPDWRTTNRGADALINYTVYKSGSGERLMFSKVLRTRIGEAATAPTLTSVKGSPSGVEIPQAGVTVEPAVTLSGVAAKGQKVEIFDGTVSKGPATADPTTGIWTLLVSALAVAAHSFTVKALYGSGATSAARTLTVTAATAPTLTSVKGTLSGREIPKGGTTAELAVSLRGIAAKGLKVEVFDHAVSQGEATADGGTGEWTFNVNGLGRVEHSFKVKALYGTRPESAPWNFTVLKAIQIPQGRLLIGQSISTETCRITFLTQSQANCYIESKGNIFPYIPHTPGSITYQANFIGQTTDRVNLRAYAGNLTGPATITIAYLNSSGATLKTTTTPVNRPETLYIDSGRLLGIASIKITVTGQVNVDQFEFGKVP